ncbi:hypothetical protein MKW98_011078 [Papaver atlanticum]|uniref:SAM domain-containing protein n=1 Tax=Papaver atlanticum TaxID=357466 RepID=A0AAD4XYH8_9MAGN|nr:hypothetical protein MKW98_011078 [Papaver atlanticum]
MLVRQEGGAVVRIPKNNYKQVINQLQTISRKLTEFDTRIKKLRNGYHDWVSNQSFVVELPVVTTFGVIHGDACGAFTGALAEVAKHVYPQHSLAIKAFSSSPMTQARIFAAMRGASVREPEEAVKAVITGVIGALVGGTSFQLGHRISPPSREYTRTRCMLSNLGLQNYEKNFEEGFLTDITIPMLTDSVLKEVGVPPGPRHLILDHIERDPELQKMRQRQ